MYLNNRENISILYVSIFISLLFNIHKLLRIFGEITAFESNWNFDLYELTFSSTISNNLLLFNWSYNF